MNGEFNICGVYIPSLVIWGIFAFILLFFLQRILAHYGFYHWVWHEGLVNIS